MGARGEGVIKLKNGHEVSVLYTNRALAGVEKRLKKGIGGILQGFDTGESGFTETAVLLHAGMEAARVDSRSSGRSVSMDDAWRVMDECGWLNVMPTIVNAAAAVLSYSAEEEDGDIDSDPNA